MMVVWAIIHLTLAVISCYMLVTEMRRDDEYYSAKDIFILLSIIGLLIPLIGIVVVVYDDYLKKYVDRFEDWINE